MIFSYNPKGVGDVLMVIVADGSNQEVTCERVGDVARITTKESQQIVGWNIFHASQHLGDIDGVGEVHLTEEQFDKLNQLLAKSQFSETLTQDTQPKFVVGLVTECIPHEDSDHLSVAQIEVGENETLQIVCGAANIKEGLKVVVARVGAMMPDGLMIWAGQLRGVDSFGMVCSAKELGLPNAPTKKGILELSDDAQVGSAFVF